MISITDLENGIMQAVELGFNYIAVMIRMDGFSEDEVIINPIGNAIKKLEYYKNTYNEDLTHKHAGDKIQIVGFTFAEDYKEIEEDFDSPIYWNKK